MEKISGILPASSRVRSADKESMTPVRPGAPSFGRPQGSSEITDRVSLSAAAKQAAEIAPNYTFNKESAQRQIADRVADDFFLTRKVDKVETPNFEAVSEPIQELDSQFETSWDFEE